MKHELPADKETLIELPLHIKGKVVDFRRLSNCLAPWDREKMLSNQGGFNNLLSAAGLGAAAGDLWLAQQSLSARQQQTAGQNNLFVPIGWPWYWYLRSYVMSWRVVADKNSGT